ncbi:MAG: hypothetical protein OEV01_05010 [Nitrospira sp.]|nr:hypothetical protein [Nitrospira sp.]MDH4303217.1 hypothetical protein [Nitrospira sp.]MDH5193591.1 hypothetical protein [Nitrospira sp.]
MSTNRFLRFLAARVLVVGATVCTLLVVTGQSVLAHGIEDLSEPTPSHAVSSSSSNLSSPESARRQAACWALTIPYGAAKMVYAVGGGIVGGLAWTVTGGNMGVAKSIWIPSMTGDYIIQPQHLTGERRLYFVGVADGPPA